MERELQLAGPFVRMDRFADRRPDICASFTAAPFRPGTWSTIIFDPPYSSHGDPQHSWHKKFGSFAGVANMRKSFYQAWREIESLLTPGGMCIFKWGDFEKPLQWCLDLMPRALKVTASTERKSKGKGGRVFFVNIVKLDGADASTFNASPSAA
jgi:hypothetical protein